MRAMRAVRQALKKKDAERYGNQRKRTVEASVKEITVAHTYKQYAAVLALLVIGFVVAIVLDAGPHLNDNLKYSRGSCKIANAAWSGDIPNPKECQRSCFVNVTVEDKSGFHPMLYVSDCASKSCSSTASVGSSVDCVFDEDDLQDVQLGVVTWESLVLAGGLLLFIIVFTVLLCVEWHYCRKHGGNCRGRHKLICTDEESDGVAKRAAAAELGDAQRSSGVGETEMAPQNNVFAQQTEAGVGGGVAAAEVAAAPNPPTFTIMLKRLIGDQPQDYALEDVQGTMTLNQLLTLLPDDGRKDFVVTADNGRVLPRDAFLSDIGIGNNSVVLILPDQSQAQLVQGQYVQGQPQAGMVMDGGVPMAGEVGMPNSGANSVAPSPAGAFAGAPLLQPAAFQPRSDPPSSDIMAVAPASGPALVQPGGVQPEAAPVDVPIVSAVTQANS